ncbi:MAG: hypothetical protein RI973_831, partial [Bacteroidota bacterium]
MNRKSTIILSLLTCLLAFLCSQVTAQTVINKLYLSDGQVLDRVDPVVTMDNTTAQSNTLVKGTASFVSSTSFKTANGGTASSISSPTPFTIAAGNDRMLIVVIGSRPTVPVDSVKFGTRKLTRLGTAVTNGTSVRTELWYLLAPPVSSATVTAHWTGSLEAVLGAAYFTGVDQTSPFVSTSLSGNTLSGTSISVSTPSSSGDVVVDIIGRAASNNFTSSSPGSIISATGTNSITIVSSYKSGAGVTTPTTTMSSIASNPSDPYAIGAVALKGASNEDAFFQMPSPLCTGYTIPAGQTITVTAHATAVTGSFGATVNASMLLGYDSLKTVLLTDATAVWDAGTSTLTWTGTLASPANIPLGEQIAILIKNNDPNLTFKVDFDSQTKPSVVQLPTTTRIDVTSVQVYPVPYPAGSTITSSAQGSTVYVRAVVINPFGDDDIKSSTFRVIDPSMVTTSVTPVTVDSNGCTKTFQYAATVSDLGTYTFRAVASQGTEGTVKDSLETTLATVSSGGFTVDKELTTPAAGPYKVGDILTFTSTVTAGGSGIGKLPLHDEFDAACMRYISASVPPTELNYGEISWANLGSVAAAGTKVVTTKFEVIANCSPMTNSAQSEGATTTAGSPLPVISDVVNFEVSEAPTVVVDNVCLSALSTTNIAVLANDSDADGDISTVSIVSNPLAAKGSISLVGNTIDFTPGSLTEEDTVGFRYRVCDLQGLCDTAWVVVRYSTTNSAPVANFDAATTTAGRELSLAILGNDTDVDGFFDVGTLTITDAPDFGSLTINPDGSINYIPNPGFEGQDQFIYQISDTGCPTPALSDTSLVRINVFDSYYVCSGTPSDLAVPAIPDAVSYTWTLPPGAMIIGPSDGNLLYVDWSGVVKGVRHEVCARATNSCGDGMDFCVGVTVDSVALDMTMENVACFGDNTGSIDLTVTNGLPDFTFAWSNGNTAEDINGLVAGTYTVTVTSEFGCTATKSATITQPAAAIDITGTVTDVVGMALGSIDISVTGGTTNLQEDFNGGEWNSLNFEIGSETGTAAGGYYQSTGGTRGTLRTVNSNLIGTASDPLVVEATLVFTAATQIAFIGTRSTGLAVAASTNEPSNSLYLRIHNFGSGDTDLSEGGSTIQQITPGAAFYGINNPIRVRMEDNGSSVTVTLTNLTTNATNTFTQATTYSSGFNHLVFSGGDATQWDSISVSPYYVYSWDSPAYTQDVSNLEGNAYTVVVTDANGCTAAKTFVVDDPGVPLKIVGIVPTHLACKNDSTGAADLSIIGGTGPFTFAWSGPSGYTATTEDISMRPAGTYSVTVTDVGTSAMVTASVTLNEPAQALSATLAHDDISCGGQTDGSIDLTASGGVLPYEYLWSNGAATQDISGLAAGSYTVTITDGNGCTITATKAITTPVDLEASAVVSDTPCDPGNAGSIDLTVTAGTPNGYLWSNGATTEDVSGLTTGKYSVTITDVNGCESYYTYEVKEVCIGVAKAVASNVNNGDGTYTVTYDVKVRNDGDVILNNVQVTENLDVTFAAPASFMLLDVTSSEFSLNGGFTGTGANTNLLASGQTLLVGDSAYISFVVKVTPGAYLGPYDNTASASGSSPDGIMTVDDSESGTDPDPDMDGPFNNSTPTPVTFPENPVIGIAKAVTSGPTIQPDGSYLLSFRFILQNAGDVPLKNVQVTDNLLTTFGATATVTVDSIRSPDLAENNAYNGNTNVNMLLGTDVMQINEFDTIDLYLRVVPAGAGPFQNTATASGNGPGGTPTTDISDNGTNPDPDNDGNPNEPGDNTPTPITFPENPEIALAKRLSAGPVSNGDGTYEISYSFIIKNVGDVLLKNVELVDDLGAVFSGASFTVNQLTTSANLTKNPAYTGTTVGSTNMLAAGNELSVGEQGTATVSITVTPGSNLGPYNNTATATGTSPFNTPVSDISHNGLDPVPDNSDPDNFSDVTPVSFLESPEISVSKRLTNTVNNGDGSYTVTYSIEVANTGDILLSNVQVTDDLAATFAGATSFEVLNVTATGTLTDNFPGYNGGANTNLLSAASSSLVVGASGTITLTVKVTPGAKLGVYQNTATGSGVSPKGTTVTDVSQDGTNADPDGDGNPNNNSKKTDVSFTENPEIGVSKDVVGAIIDNGDGTYDITYQIYVVNTGDVRLTDVQIVEDLSTTFPSPATFTVGLPTITVQPANTTLTVNASYNGTSNSGMLAGADTLLVGENATLQLVVTVDPNGVGGPYLNSTIATGTSPAGQDLLDYSQDGIDPDPDASGGPSDNSIPTPVSLFENPQIGIAKAVSSVTYNGDGTNDVVFDLVIGNYGDVRLCDLKVYDDILTQFAAFAPISNFDGSDGQLLAMNLAWDGTATSNILMPNQCLEIGEKDTLQIRFRLTVTQQDTVNNTATAEGTGPLGGVTTDSSEVGRDPDPNMDLDPSDNNVPTPVILIAPPTAVDDLYYTKFDVNVSGDVSGNDKYPGGSSFADIGGPSNGSLTFNPDGTFTYDPDPGFTGADTFTYIVCMPAPNATVCDTAIAVIVVAPAAIDDAYVTPYETPKIGDVSDNDNYAYGSTFAIVDDVDYGSTVFSSTGSFLYTPNAGFTGIDTFTYVVCLPIPYNTSCDTAIAVIVVGPNAVDDYFTTPFNTDKTAFVDGNDTYPPGSTFAQVT